MLTAKQRELLQFIHDRLRQSGVSPSFDEMREALDLKSKSGVHRLISALEERQFIRRLPNRARALEVIKMPETLSPTVAAALATKAVVPAAANDTIEIPLHGRIAAGTPIEALQGTEGFAVPAALLGPGEHYALEVSGDSMVEEGILDGDFALIRKVDTARDGEIVVALIDDEEATLKTYPPRGPDDPPRPRQPRLRAAALRRRPGQHPGPACRPHPALLSRMARDRLCRAAERHGA